MHAAVFDARQAKLLKPGDYLTFEGVPGLRLMASTKGRRWLYRYKDPATGLMKRVELGGWPAMDWAKAIAALETKRSERKNGDDPVETKRAQRKAKVEKAAAKRRAEEGTCKAVVEAYLQEMVEPNRKAKGAAESRRMLTRAIAGHESTLADDLTTELAHSIILAIAGTARRVAAMTRAELRAAWNYGLETGRIGSANPFAGRNVGGKLASKTRKRALSLGEVAELLRWLHAPGNYSRSISDALELTLRTGLRSGEVVGIHSSEIKERDGVLWLDIPGERMKMGEPHSAPLVGRAREIALARMPQGEEGGYLFPSRDGKPILQKALGVEVYAHSGRSAATAYAHLAVCPVKDWAPHDLRRTARTMLADMGCPFEVGEAILAHQLPGVAGVYQRAEFVAEKVRWLKALGEKLDTLEAEKKVAALRRTA